MKIKKQNPKEINIELNRIYLGDCLDVLKALPDKSIDLCLTDPPYGINIVKKGRIGGHGKQHTSKAWDDSTPSDVIFTEIIRVSKNYIIWGGNYFNLPTARCFLVWDKGEAAYKSNFALCEMAMTSFNKNADIFKYSNTNPLHCKEKIHPTQKPLKLFEWCLQNYSNVGDIILDPFSGSGTTALACHTLKRQFICVEKDQEYYDSSTKRLIRHQDQLLLDL